MKCKSCQQDVPKTPIARNGITRFVDGNNQLWNGKMCPDCYRKYNKERMRFKRKSEKVATDTQPILVD